MSARQVLNLISNNERNLMIMYMEIYGTYMNAANVIRLIYIRESTIHRDATHVTLFRAKQC